MVLEWTLGLKRLAYSRISAAASVYISRETQNHQTFCVSLVLVSNLQSCMSIFSETLHDHHIWREPQRFQATMGAWGPRDRSQCMKLVLVSFTLTSYLCISIVSHFTVMFARGTCASWSSSYFCCKKNQRTERNEHFLNTTLNLLIKHVAHLQPEGMVLERSLSSLEVCCSSYESSHALVSPWY